MIAVTPPSYGSHLAGTMAIAPLSIKVDQGLAATRDSIRKNGDNPEGEAVPNGGVGVFLLTEFCLHHGEPCVAPPLWRGTNQTVERHNAGPRPMSR